MNTITVRAMKDQDSPAVLKGQKKAFSPLLGLFLSKPKKGLVAEADNRIVGAVTYNTIPVKGQTSGPAQSKPQLVGYLDIAYVDRDYRGQKLGSRLFDAAIDQLHEEGCEIITATIRDDNRASWRNMERNGCTIQPFYRLISKFGLSGALRLGAQAHLAYAVGHEFWVTDTASKKKFTPLSALPAFLIINFLLILLAARGNVPFSLGALLVFGVEIGFGWLGTLGQPARWYVQRPHSALLLSLFVAVIRGILPNNASWQLVEGSYRSEARASLLGRTSLFSWIGVICVTAGSFITLLFSSQLGVTSFQDQLLSGVLNLGLMYLIYRTLAVFPFESFGGLRVYAWKPVLFWFLALISTATIAGIFILSR